MAVLIAGLVVFLGLHSTRVFADDWRSARIKSLGEPAWKGIYSVVSVIGFALIVWGYAIARQHPVVLYVPPIWTRHLASLLTLLAFVLLAAAYVPRNHLKSSIGHPMVAGAKLWAFAHLLANGTLADVLLFGGFLVWSVLLFRASRARDRANGVARAAPSAAMTLVTIGAGVVAWIAFAFWLHGWLIGVRPFG
ncbi:MAG: NnrU family protein [Lautropia sp.]